VSLDPTETHKLHGSVEQPLGKKEYGIQQMPLLNLVSKPHCLRPLQVSDRDKFRGFKGGRVSVSYKGRILR
jgi:hypothetical protein